MARLCIVWPGLGVLISALAVKTAVRVSSANVWFRAVWRTFPIRAEISSMVVGASGALSWGGAKELSWAVVNTPPSTFWGGDLELTDFAGPCPLRDSTCAGRY